VGARNKGERVESGTTRRKELDVRGRCKEDIVEEDRRSPVEPCLEEKGEWARIWASWLQVGKFGPTRLLSPVILGYAVKFETVLFLNSKTIDYN
jgi:hypothetical protein